MSEVVPADDVVVAQLLEIEELRQRALTAGDLLTLDDLFDESLIHIHAPGLIHTKAQLMEHVSVRQAYLGIARGELTIRLIGDVAIMTGPLMNRLRTAEGGERTLGGVVTQVLRRCEDTKWRFVHFQMTPNGDHAWPALPSQLQAEEKATAPAGGPEL